VPLSHPYRSDSKTEIMFIIAMRKGDE